MFARTLGLARLFTPRNASCAIIHQPVARLLRQPLLYLLWQHLIWHLVCVCVRVSGWISQPYIVLCPVSKHKLAEMPQQDRFLWMTPLNSCKNNGWDGETELSSHAPARPQTARLKHVRHIETPRSAKHEANNRLYKIWPLWQNVSINIVFISLAKTSAHSCLHCPSAILQREGFWQHKGLGKNINTYYDFGCECHPDLQRLGNTKRARLLLEVDVDSGGWNGQFLFPFNGLTAQTITQVSGVTPSMDITLFSSQTALLSKLIDHTRIHPQTMNSPHMLLTRKLCCLIVIALSNEKTEKPWGSTFLRSSMFWRSWLLMDMPPDFELFLSRLALHCPFVLLLDLKRVPSKLKATGVVLRQWAIKTQPLSKCMLLVCAYQITRQRNIGIAKKSCQGFWRLIGKGRLFGRPFFKTNTQELSTPMCPPRNSWTTQRRCQKKNAVYLKSCPILYPTTYEEHPMNNNDILRVTLAQHLLYHSKGEMLRREQSKGHRKGRRAWQKDIQSL